MAGVRAATFLPLTTDAAARLGGGRHHACERALAVRRRAEETERAASTCWTSLLAGCDSAGRSALGPRLRRLSEAASLYVGTRWWFTDGSAHRHKVASAQAEIEDAVAEADGQEFALAFVGYDHAMASAVVCGARTRPGSHHL